MYLATYWSSNQPTEKLCAQLHTGQVTCQEKSSVYSATHRPSHQPTEKLCIQQHTGPIASQGKSSEYSQSSYYWCLVTQLYTGQVTNKEREQLSVLTKQLLLICRELLSLLPTLLLAAAGCNHHTDTLITTPLPFHGCLHNSALAWKLKCHKRNCERKRERGT